MKLKEIIIFVIFVVLLHNISYGQFFREQTKPSEIYTVNAAFSNDSLSPYTNGSACTLDVDIGAFARKLKFMPEFFALNVRFDTLAFVGMPASDSSMNCDGVLPAIGWKWGRMDEDDSMLTDSKTDSIWRYGEDSLRIYNETITWNFSDSLNITEKVRFIAFPSTFANANPFRRFNIELQFIGY